MWVLINISINYPQKILKNVNPLLCYMLKSWYRYDKKVFSFFIYFFSFLGWTIPLINYFSFINKGFSFDFLLTCKYEIVF